MKKMAKRKVKRRIRRWLFIMMLPLIKLLLITVIILAIFIEIPRMVGSAVRDYLGSIFGGSGSEVEYVMSPHELKELFLTTETPLDMQGIQEFEYLASLIDLQLSSGLYKVKAPITVERYRDGSLYSVETIPHFLEFSTADYTTPWQFLAAIEIYNENWGITHYSDEVMMFDRLTRPLFDGYFSHDFKPSYFKEIVSVTDYTETVENITLDEEGEESVSYSTYEWTETTVIKEPLPLLKSIEFFGGKKEYDISPSKSSSSYSDHSEEEGVTLSSRTTVTTTTFTGDEGVLSSEPAKLFEALLVVVAYEDFDFFLDILSGYPYSDALLVLLDDGYNGFEGEAGELTHRLVYPRLRYHEDGLVHREDLVKLALSVEGLDYFWGGKHPRSGFNENWGKLRHVFADGHRMSGRYKRFGFDCSGYTEWIYANVGVNIGGMRQIISQGKFHEITLADLKPGDLAIYHDYSSGNPNNHIGMYLGYEGGKHLFIHAGGYQWADISRPHGQVIISALDERHNGFPGVRFRKFYRYNGVIVD